MYLYQLLKRYELEPIPEELLIHSISEILFAKYKFIYIVH